MIRLEFIIKFMSDGLSDSMVFPRELATNLKEVAKLDKNIYLVGPSGSRWEARLLKRGGHFCLGDGWKEFIQDHYVMNDDRLIFKYCGNSCFTVLIFDKTGCERESCYFVKNGRIPASNKLLHGCQKNISQSSEDNERSFRKSGKYDDTQLSSDDCSSSSGFYSAENSHSKKRMSHDQSPKTPKYEKDCINLYASSLRSYLRKSTKKSEMKTHGPKTEDCAQRLVKAISKRNPCFFKVLPASSKYDLLIPQAFVVNCKLFKQQLTTLKIPRNKEWAVEYSCRGSRWFLMWRTFAKDNCLKEGDACVFELTDYCPKMVMVVHFFRAS